MDAVSWCDGVLAFGLVFRLVPDAMFEQNCFECSRSVHQDKLESVLTHSVREKYNVCNK